MKLLNWKFFSRVPKTQKKEPSRQERKKLAREARAAKLAKRLKGKSLMPWFGTRGPDLYAKTRQGQRLRLRHEAFNDLTKQFSGEPRRIRRAMARDLAKRLWKRMRVVA